MQTFAASGMGRPNADSCKQVLSADVLMDKP